MTFSAGPPTVAVAPADIGAGYELAVQRVLTQLVSRQRSAILARRQILREINTKGKEAHFAKTERGHFALAG